MCIGIVLLPVAMASDLYGTKNESLLMAVVTGWGRARNILKIRVHTYIQYNTRMKPGYMPYWPNEPSPYHLSFYIFFQSWYFWNISLACGMWHGLFPRCPISPLFFGGSSWGRWHCTRLHPGRDSAANCASAQLERSTVLGQRSGKQDEAMGSSHRNGWWVEFWTVVVGGSTY